MIVLLPIALNAVLVLLIVPFVPTPPFALHAILLTIYQLIKNLAAFNVTQVVFSKMLNA